MHLERCGGSFLLTSSSLAIFTPLQCSRQSHELSHTSSQVLALVTWTWWVDEIRRFEIEIRLACRRFVILFTTWWYEPCYLVLWARWPEKCRLAFDIPRLLKIIGVIDVCIEECLGGSWEGHREDVAARIGFCHLLCLRLLEVLNLPRLAWPRQEGQIKFGSIFWGDRRLHKRLLAQLYVDYVQRCLRLIEPLGLFQPGRNEKLLINLRLLDQVSILVEYLFTGKAVGTLSTIISGGILPACGREVPQAEFRATFL